MTRLLNRNRSRFHPSELFQHFRVTPQRAEKAFLCFVRHAKFNGCIPHNNGDASVVHVTDVSEQVMFHLVVESTDEP